MASMLGAVLATCAAVLGVGCSASKEPSTASYSMRPEGAAAGSARDSSLFPQIADGFDETWVVVRRGVESNVRPAGDDGVRIEDFRGGSLLAPPASPDAAPRAFPLASMHVDAELTGPIASVEVVQRFENPFSDTIEAVYVFPLPHDAAVSDFTMTIGTRRIRGVVRERDEAERIYHSAKSRGHVASLLVQDDSNVFRERIANIEPGRSIEVAIEYFHSIPYLDGWYEWRMPLAIGPRFAPNGAGSWSGVDRTEAVPAGHSARTGRVEGIEYAAGAANALGASIEARVDPGCAIEDLIVPSHAGAIVERNGDTARVRIDPSSAALDRDVVLRWRVGGDELRHGVVSSMGQDGRGTFLLTIYPPAAVRDARRMPVDLVFLLDRSGSMRGRPLEQAKAVIAAALDRLRSDDRFALVDFGTTAETFRRGLHWADGPAVDEARRHLARIDADGGTMVATGLAEAMAIEKEEGRVQYIVFVGDGFVSNEEEIARLLHRELGGRRVFALGVGTSVNWSFMHRVAVIGRGAAASLALEDDPRDVMMNVVDAIATPALANAAVQWSGGSIEDVIPRTLPDIRLGRPVTIVGRYGASGSATATASGWVHGQRTTVRMPMRLAHDVERRGLDKIWARAKIADLADQALVHGDARAMRSDVLATALRYGIASPFTAFVAVDATRTTEGVERTTIVQPSPLPAGIRYRVEGSGSIDGGRETDRDD
jgi:Ca-activated chloride channel family protein